jgi:effector-binding domain-containing protein
MVLRYNIRALNSLNRRGKVKITSCIISLLFILLSPGDVIPGNTAQTAKVDLKEIEPFSYCCLEYTGSFSDIENIVNNLIATMQSQNIAPSGGLLAVYNASRDEAMSENMKWEVGFPVYDTAMAQPPLMKKRWTHTLVASAVHAGSFETSNETIDQILDWIEANNYDQDGPIMGTFQREYQEDDTLRDQTAEIWVPVKERNSNSQ